jgi:hypothetical protein
MRHSRFARYEAVDLQVLFSPDEERSRGEVQIGDEGQAVPELRSRDEECSPGEPEAEVQAVDELQAANEARSA